MTSGDFWGLVLSDFCLSRINLGDSTGLPRTEIIKYRHSEDFQRNTSTF